MLNLFIWHNWLSFQIQVEVPDRILPGAYLYERIYMVPNASAIIVVPLYVCYWTLIWPSGCCYKPLKRVEAVTLIKVKPKRRVEMMRILARKGRWHKKLVKFPVKKVFGLLYINSKIFWDSSCQKLSSYPVILRLDLVHRTL